MMVITLIEKVYSFLWGDLFQIPLPGGGSVGISLLIILLIPTGNLFHNPYKISSNPSFPGDGKIVE